MRNTKLAGPEGTEEDLSRVPTSYKGKAGNKLNGFRRSVWEAAVI